MGKLWMILTHLHSLAGPTVTLLYPLYKSVQALESPSKLDDQQWLAYWILYSFITLLEMILKPLIYWIPIWYELKLVFMAWLVLPNFRGAAFIYDKLVREQVKKHSLMVTESDNISNQDKSAYPFPREKKTKRKFLSFLTRKG